MAARTRHVRRWGSLAPRWIGQVAWNLIVIVGENVAGCGRQPLTQVTGLCLHGIDLVVESFDLLLLMLKPGIDRIDNLVGQTGDDDGTQPVVDLAQVDIVTNIADFTTLFYSGMEQVVEGQEFLGIDVQLHASLDLDQVVEWQNICPTLRVPGHVETVPRTLPTIVLSNVELVALPPDISDGPDGLAVDQ